MHIVLVIIGYAIGYFLIDATVGPYIRLRRSKRFYRKYTKFMSMAHRGMI